MTIQGAMNISMQGFGAQSTLLSATASNVSNAVTPGYRRQATNFLAGAPAAGTGVTATISTATAGSSATSSNVDPLQEAIGMEEAKQGASLNASVFEAGADMWQMLASVKRD